MMNKNTTTTSTSSSPSVIYQQNLDSFHKYLDTIEESLTYLRNIDNHTSNSNETNQVFKQAMESLIQAEKLYLQKLNPTNLLNENVRVTVQQQALDQVVELEQHLNLMNKGRDLEVFKKCVKKGIMKFKWHHPDIWTTFLDFQFNYIQMNSELLYEDSCWLHSVKSQVKTEPNGSVRKEIVAYFESVLTKGDHAISQVIDEYRIKFVKSCKVVSRDTAKNFVQKVVYAFSVKLSECLFNKHWGWVLDGCHSDSISSMKKIATYYLMDYILTSSGRYKVILDVYHHAQLEQDGKWNRKVAQLKQRNLTMKQFHVSEALRLDEHGTTSAQPFQPSMDKLVEFDRGKPVAQEQLLTFIEAIQELSNYVTVYTDRNSERSDKSYQLVVGADDVLSILCYLFVKLELKNMCSRLTYIVDCLDEQELLSDIGYGVATFETVVNHLLAFEVDTTSASPQKKQNSYSHASPGTKSVQMNQRSKTFVEKALVNSSTPTKLSRSLSPASSKLTEIKNSYEKQIQSASPPSTTTTHGSSLAIRPRRETQPTRSRRGGVKDRIAWFEDRSE